MAAEAVQLTVGELATRIWHATGHDSTPIMELVGIRPGETLSEVLTAPGETIVATSRQGIAPIVGEISTAAAAWVLERLTEGATREDARAVWLEALRRPGLLQPNAAATP